MRYLVTCNGPTGRLLDEKWVDSEGAAFEAMSLMRKDWPGKVFITYRSEQEIEDGE